MGVLFMSELIAGEKGMKTAIEQAHDPAAPVPGAVDGEQLALLPLPLCQGEQKPAGANSGSPHRGAGRPPGAKNKSTEIWTEFLLSRYSSPLMGLAEIYSRSIADLARELGFITETRVLKPEQALELLKLQVSCMEKLAPYVHKKQPMAIDTGEGGLIQLVINTGAPQNQVAPAAINSLEILEIKNEENQSLSNSENQEFNELQSNEFE